ncbi:hypothetical protein OEV98_04050 [Caldibacillus lycopersici]|uniref:Uncharacterized protein n=1 Tax=Perspicuibacillus lycopersici TaxID=1325689 RepID=A0AAE3IR95_9BACI|nr:hypothetical protein [Perspicuibacillus lycopersici]MCU9612737.1 hypothetical protein [Perspicuibacillus lycopersici]
MLKLIVDNSTKFKKKITCRNSCELFDSITGNCGIFDGVNVDSEIEVRRCAFFISNVETETDNLFFDEDFHDEELANDKEVFHALAASKTFHERQSLYPNQPDLPAGREDAIWYVDSSGKYGCWIINKYRHPLPEPLNYEQSKKGWTSIVYRSPVPLHNHESPISIASRIAWYIDEDGYGQYVMLVNGRISLITSPKPPNWK